MRETHLCFVRCVSNRIGACPFPSDDSSPLTLPLLFPKMCLIEMRKNVLYSC